MADCTSAIWFAVGAFASTAWDRLLAVELRLTDQQPKTKEVVKGMKTVVKKLRDRAVTIDFSHDWSLEAAEASVDLVKFIMNWQLVIEKAVETKTDLLSDEHLQSNLDHFELSKSY